MQISITEKEYDAICFAFAQVDTSVEGSTDEVYNKEVEKATAALSSLKEKYKEARYKADLLKKFAADVQELYPDIPKSSAMKLARKVVKDYIQTTNNYG